MQAEKFSDFAVSEEVQRFLGLTVRLAHPAARLLQR
jgi:hypothetical protein